MHSYVDLVLNPLCMWLVCFASLLTGLLYHSSSQCSQQPANPCSAVGVHVLQVPSRADCRHRRTYWERSYGFHRQPATIIVPAGALLVRRVGEQTAGVAQRARGCETRDAAFTGVFIGREECVKAVRSSVGAVSGRLGWGCSSGESFGRGLGRAA